jgi:hypothetical protein
MNQLPKCFQKALQELDERKEFIEALYPTFILATKLLDNCRNLYEIPDQEKYNAPSIHIGYEVNLICGVIVTVRVYKYSEVGVLLEQFELNGWTLSEKRKPNPEPYKAIGRMTWYLVNKKYKHNVVISAFFHDVPEACQWVAETKMEEVKHYRMVCPEDRKIS